MYATVVDHRNHFAACIVHLGRIMFADCLLAI